MISRIIFIWIIFSLVACSNFPKDSENTLEDVRGNILKAGISSDDSLSVSSAESFSYQKNFIEQFAKSLHAEVQWIHEDQSSLAELLRNYEINLAIGGFVKPSPFKEKVTISKTYYVKRYVVTGVKDIQSLKGKKVFVHDYFSDFNVRKKGGIPVWSDALPKPGEIWAASEEELSGQNIPLPGVTLVEQDFAIAIPKGESAFLIELEKFIDSHGNSR